MKPEPPLQPLRIPSGWLIAFNSWHEIDPEADQSTGFLDEDLLQLTHSHYNLLVDVGFYGDVTEGVFGAVVQRGDFLGPELAEFHSRDRLEVVAVVEQWLRSAFSFQEGESPRKDVS